MNFKLCEECKNVYTVPVSYQMSVGTFGEAKMLNLPKGVAFAPAICACGAVYQIESDGNGGVNSRHIGNAHRTELQWDYQPIDYRC